MNILRNTAFAHIFVGVAMAAIVGVGHADDAKTAIGGGLGAAAGTAIGQSIGGKTGAVIGGAVGGATGAAAGTKGPAQSNAAIGGALGGAAGAVVGQSIGGKTGAIVGAGLGGASGATVGKNIGDPPPAVATTKTPRPDGNLKHAAYDDKEQHRHKKHKKHCDKDHPGQGHAYGKYKHCD